MAKMEALSRSDDYQPWLYEKEWQNGHIHSSARSKFLFSLLFSLFWNLISFPIAYFSIHDVYHSWNITYLDPVLFVLLFPLVGVALLVWAFKNYQQWSAFGRLSMTLDPYPGSIGGEVGGFLDLPVRWQSDYQFEVTLNCIHHTIRRSGKNSSHHQEVVWKKFSALDFEPSGQGIRLKFKCPVDDGLYESEEKTGQSYYRWVIHVKGSLKSATKMSLDRQFDIPVFKLEEPQRSQLHVMATAPGISVDQIDEHQVKIRQNTRSLELDYPTARNTSRGWGLFIVALVFLSVTGFLFFETWSEINSSYSLSFFSVGITGFMSLVFGAVSLAMLGYSIHLLSHRLIVHIDSSGLRVKGYSLLHHSDKSVSLSDIQSINKTSNMSSGQGVSATRYFTLSAQLDNHETVILGNGIKGQLVADSLVELLNQHIKSLTGIYPEATGNKNENSVFNNQKMVGKVKKHIKTFTIISNVIALLIIFAFIYDFFK